MLALFGAMGYVITTMTMAPAHADPVSGAMEHNAQLNCRQLDANSSPEGFDHIINAMLAAGLSNQETADTLTYAITSVCPEYYDEFEVALKWARKVHAI